MSIYDEDPDTGITRGGPGWHEDQAEVTRACLRCGKDLAGQMGVYVFAGGEPVPGVLFCVEHGSNGANSISREEYEALVTATEHQARREAFEAEGTREYRIRLDYGGEMVLDATDVQDAIRIYADTFGDYKSITSVEAVSCD